jgi:hypothetical protein
MREEERVTSGGHQAVAMQKKRFTTAWWGSSTDTAIPFEIFKTIATSYSRETAFHDASDWVTFTFVDPGFTFWCGGLPVAPGLGALIHH